jgi:hypothetical protein
MLAFRRDLEKAICAVLSNPKKVDNPVRSFFLANAGISKSVENAERHLIENLQGEIASLRQDLLLQFSKMRDVMRVATVAVRPDQDLAAARRLEGVWKAPKDGSVFCIKMLGDDLHVPYCYGGQDRLMGHLFSCIVRGDIITCRFEWLNSEINGFAVLRAIGDDTLSGGWCFAENLPLTARTLSSIEKLPLDGLVELTVHRAVKSKYPDWAIQYFHGIQAESQPKPK